MDEKLIEEKLAHGHKYYLLEYSPIYWKVKRGANERTVATVMMKP